MTVVSAASAQLEVQLIRNNPSERQDTEVTHPSCLLLLIPLGFRQGRNTHAAKLLQLLNALPKLLLIWQEGMSARP